jgi:hypothetical protein
MGLTLQVVGVPDVHERFDLSSKGRGLVVSADTLLGLLV